MHNTLMMPENKALSGTAVNPILRYNLQHLRSAFSGGISIGIFVDGRGIVLFLQRPSLKALKYFMPGT